jgi:hypothetical protein
MQIPSMVHGEVHELWHGSQGFSGGTERADQGISGVPEEKGKQITPHF